MKPNIDDGGRSTDLEKMNKLADQCRKIVGTEAYQERRKRWLSIVRREWERMGEDEIRSEISRFQIQNP